MSNLSTRLGGWRENEPRVRQALKTTIAACLAYAIAEFFAMPQAFWAAVVAIFVTQANIGASLSQALAWFLGSLVGVVVGGAVVVLVGDAVAMRLTGLAAAVFVLAYFATSRPPIRIACINAAIIILANPMHGSPIDSAGYRMIEVVIGTVVAISTMLIIFPSRAGPALVKHVSQTLPLYFQLISEVLTAALTGRYDDQEIAATNAQIRAAVTTNADLRQQALTEVAGFLADNADPELLLTALRRLWHTGLMLARAVSSPLPAIAVPVLRKDLEELRDAVDGARAQLGNAGADKIGAVANIATVKAAVARFNATIAGMREAGKLRDMPMDDVIRLMTFDFGLEQLRQNLKDLSAHIKTLEKFAGAHSS